ncbi:MAG: tetratricopeptide repeat protein [Candidatus Riflebacteria bacterium]|nr:tetratricopeptide repeat protein [Candidatus Riflebacteria bacterium]
MNKIQTLKLCTFSISNSLHHGCHIIYRNKRYLFLLVFFCVVFISSCYAQESDEATEFLKRGADLYKSLDLKNAVIEFENVLLIEPSNIDAQAWLVRIYADLKQVKRAQDLLATLKKQAPDHPKVKELEALFGDGSNNSVISGKSETLPNTGKPGKSDKSGKSGKSGKPDKTGKKSAKAGKTENTSKSDILKLPAKGPQQADNIDFVVHETLTLLGSGTQLRQFGLVIPEAKVKAPLATDVILAEDNGGTPGSAEGPALEKFDANEGPLAEAFDVWASDGISAGLDKYFELVLADKALAAMNDRKILEEGIAYFTPRLTANPKDEDACFYLGMIAFFNGNMDKARELLEPLRDTERPFKRLLKPVFAEFDRIKAEENARKLALKRDDDLREEARRKAEEAAAQASASSAIAANLASVTANGGIASAPSANANESVDGEGYDLYKKGQLDAAIEKFQIAIKGSPNDPKYQYHLGLALTDKGLAGSNECFDRAIEAFNKVVQLDPGGKLAKDAEVMIRDLVAAKNSVRN